MKSSFQLKNNSNKVSQVNLLFPLQPILFAAPNENSCRNTFHWNCRWKGMVGKAKSIFQDKLIWSLGTLPYWIKRRYLNLSNIPWTTVIFKGACAVQERLSQCKQEQSRKSKQSPMHLRGNLLSFWGVIYWGQFLPENSNSLKAPKVAECDLQEVIESCVECGSGKKNDRSWDNKTAAMM